MKKLNFFFQHVILRKYLKSIISGKLFLKKHPKEMEKIDFLKKKFLSIDYNFSKDHFSKFIFLNIDNAAFNLSGKLRNIFFSDRNTVSYSFLNQIYATFAREKYKTEFFLPLYDKQISFIKNNSNINISVWKCKFFFLLLILKNLLKGFFFGLKILIISLKYIIIKKEKLSKNYIFFDLEVNPSEFKNVEKDNNFFLVNKFLKKFKMSKNITIHVKPKSGVKNLYNKEYFFQGYKYIFKSNPYPHLKNIKSYFKYFFWLIFSFLICLKDLIFFNRWYNSFLFFEASKSRLFYLSSDIEIPQIFITPYFGGLTRSLWTIDFEKQIKRSYLFFYSTNGDGYKTKLHTPNDTSNWGELEYKHYLVWDNYQYEILKKNLKIKDPKIVRIGPILGGVGLSWIKSLKKVKKKNIAIFDIIPNRLVYEYFNSFSIIESKYIIEFLTDILKVAQELDLNILHKTKRFKDKKMIATNYVRTVEKLKYHENYKEVSQDVSLENLINNCSCTISFPYSSTSIISDKLNTPTVFYDPSKLLIDLDEKIQSHGIRIINNKEDLKNWIKENIN